MSSWNTVPSDDVIKTVEGALTANGMIVHVAENGKAASDLVFSLIPSGAEVMTMSSMTLETFGIAKELNESGKYQAAKPKLMKMDRSTQGKEMQAMGATSDWAIGSVHALTEQGQAVIASLTGSQLPAYAYGSSHVVWVVGAQKIVKNLDEGFKRIYEYCLPLESERAKKAYGVEGSSVNKLLVINKEVTPERIHVIIVKESVGF